MTFFLQEKKIDYVKKWFLKLANFTGYSKVNSVQEACTKCFAVHTLKFEILKHMKKENKNIYKSDVLWFIFFIDLQDFKF